MAVSYEILGRYRGGEKEVIDEADTRAEATRLVQEYRLAFGAEWSIWRGRARCKAD